MQGDLKNTKSSEQPANAGVFYLHCDGALVWKEHRKHADILKYSKAHCLKEYWEVPKNTPTKTAEGDIVWVLGLLYDAFLLGAKKEDICTFIQRLGFYDAEQIYSEFVQKSRKNT